MLSLPQVRAALNRIGGLDPLWPDFHPSRVPLVVWDGQQTSSVRQSRASGLSVDGWRRKVDPPRSAPGVGGPYGRDAATGKQYQVALPLGRFALRLASPVSRLESGDDLVRAL